MSQDDSSLLAELLQSMSGSQSDSRYGYDPKKIEHVYRYDFWSLDEHADFVEKHGGVYDPGWTGSNTLKYAREGWKKHEEEAMEVCDAATRLVETETELFIPTHDVTGADVDMGPYMAGEPECMVNYPLQRESNVGNVVTLCADVQTLGVVSNATIIRRGLTVAGLAMALNRLGHNTELWVSDEYWISTRPTERIIIRTLVKGHNDFIDPSKILFAYAHPGVQRGMNFRIAAQTEGFDGKYGKHLSGGFGSVTTTTKDLPEGTIYMPPLFRDSDAPNPEMELRRYLMQLGLLEGDDD